MHRRFLVSLVALTLGLFAGCGPMSRTEKIAALTGTATAGKTVYEANCSSCHGSSGKGTPSSSNVDITDHVKEHPAADFLAFIVNGVPNTNMASYASLSDQQLADLYAYIKNTLAK